MPINANHKIIISAGNPQLTFECYKAVKETLIKRFGESSIVFSVSEIEPVNGRYYAYIYLNLDKPLSEYFNIPVRSGIKLKEVQKDASEGT
jgi:hypothetical protein